MTSTDWTVCTFAGAAWGGVFWLALPMLTSLLRSEPPPHAGIVTVAVAVVVGVAGFALARATRRPGLRRTAVALAIGALVGLPVVAWFALWQNVIV